MAEFEVYITIFRCHYPSANVVIINDFLLSLSNYRVITSRTGLHFIKSKKMWLVMPSISGLYCFRDSMRPSGMKMLNFFKNRNEHKIVLVLKKIFLLFTFFKIHIGIPDLTCPKMMSLLL